MIRTVLLVASALVLAGPAPADDKPKPNTLTPKEIADGWIMLFDGETTFGWKIAGDAKVKDGLLVLGGEKLTQATQTTRFSDYELHMETVTGAGELEIGAPGYRARFHLGKSPMKSKVTVRTIPGRACISSRYDVGPDKVGVATSTVTTEVTPEFGIQVPAGKTLPIKSIKLRPLNTTPLFNGKDLSGWKVFQDPKRNKSVFAVTKDGDISVKNGPGDLQTGKKFDNFVLQLECKTNGKHLNSGIFFRCMENQYQNGYEAQVQNGFNGTDRTKPLDYGTGAIYRRVAARKVVSNDNEWFTMTVVANGPHLATWVNGYQTVDWIDDRKPSDNPRQGLRTAAGHISIQGHDPTTDLLFRNIRIAELK